MPTKRNVCHLQATLEASNASLPCCLSTSLFIDVGLPCRIRTIRTKDDQARKGLETPDKGFKIKIVYYSHRCKSKPPNVDSEETKLSFYQNT